MLKYFPSLLIFLVLCLRGGNIFTRTVTENFEKHMVTMGGWLVGFYRISTIVGYLMPSVKYQSQKQFYFKQFSLA